MFSFTREEKKRFTSIFRKREFQMLPNPLSYACRQGLLEVVVWHHENGLLEDPENCMRLASISGKIEIIKWLYEHGDKIEARPMFWAAGKGHIEVVEWFREKGCRLSFSMMEAAVIGDQLHMIEYLIENGCPRDKEQESRLAEYHDRKEIAEWFMNH